MKEGYSNSTYLLLLLEGKISACNIGDLVLIPGSGRFPRRREWLPTPVFVPGEFHGRRSLVSYSPWSHKELDMTERLWASLVAQMVKNLPTKQDS